jgi:type IV pilus assembly protein PilE
VLVFVLGVGYDVMAVVYYLGMVMKRINSGFTLVELMVVVAIIGILASIALPSYTAYVARSKVAEATSNLSNLRVALEQYYQDNRTYVGGVVLPPAGTDKNFTYTSVVAATTYTLTATGKAAQNMSGYVYTINESNAKTSTVGGVAGNTCWLASSSMTC